MKVSEIDEGTGNMILSSIKILQTLVYVNSEKHGFWDTYDRIFHNQIQGIDSAMKDDLMNAILGQKIALITTETSEMLEGVRKPVPDQHCSDFSSEEIEAADQIIRILDYAEKRKLRLGEAIFVKMIYNESRPVKHGKAF